MVAPASPPGINKETTHSVASYLCCSYCKGQENDCVVHSSSTDRETEKLKVEKVLAKNSISNRKLCNAARALLRPSLIAPVIDGKLAMLEPRPDRTSTNDVTHRNS